MSADREAREAAEAYVENEAEGRFDYYFSERGTRDAFLAGAAFQAEHVLRLLRSEKGEFMCDGECLADWLAKRLEAGE